MLDQLELLDTKEMQRIFGITRKTLYRMVKDGRLPAPTRIGSSHKWFSTSVVKAVAEMKAKSEKNLKSANKEVYRAKYRRRA
jgi:predicted DNA-binding transcriptional regulator AlpA